MILIPHYTPSPLLHRITVSPNYIDLLCQNYIWKQYHRVVVFGHKPLQNKWKAKCQSDRYTRLHFCLILIFPMGVCFFDKVSQSIANCGIRPVESFTCAKFQCFFSGWESWSFMYFPPSSFDGAPSNGTNPSIIMLMSIEFFFSSTSW